MQNRASALILLLGLPASLAIAAPPEVATEPAPVFFRAPAHTLCMADGLRVRTHSLTNTPLARTQLALELGADRDLARIATLMWLRSYVEPPPPPVVEEEEEEEIEEEEEEVGPPPPPPPSVHQQLEALGVRYDLIEGPDLLTFSAVAPPAVLPALLALQQRQLTDPLANVTQADLDAARAELLSGAVDPDRALWRAAASALYPDSHPYHPAPGDLSAYTLDDVRAFAARAFRPEQMMLTITADLSQLDRPKDRIRRALAGDPDALTPPPPPPVSPATTAPVEGEAAPEAVPAPAPAPMRIVVEDSDCVQSRSADSGLAPELPTLKSIRIPAQVDGPEAMIVWPLPGAFTGEDLTWELLPVIAEEFLYRTLSKKAMPAQLPTDLVSCSFLPGLQASALACRIPVGRDGDQAKIARKVVSANDVLWYPDAATKLREAMPELRQRLRGRILLRAADGVDGELVAQTWESTYDWMRGEQYPHLSRMSALDDLDPKKVLETYRRWMNPERITVVSLVPDGERPDIADDPLANDFALSGPWAPLPPPWQVPPPPPPPEEGEEIEEEEEEEEIEEEEIEIAALTASELAAMAENPILAGVERAELPGGMSLIVVERPGYPVARATLIHEGGVLREPTPGLDALAWEASSPLRSREGHYVPAWPLEGQATWHRERLPGAWVQGLTGPAGNLEGLLYILREAVREPVVEPQLMKDHLFYAGRRYRPTAWQALRLASYDAFFGPEAPLSSPYVSKKDRKALLETEAGIWTAAVVSPEASTLVVISPLPAAEIRAAVEASFGDWSGGTEPREIARPDQTPRQAVLLMAGPGPLAEVDIRCPLGSKANNNPTARMLLADMLELSVWEQTRDNPPVSFSVHVEELGGGEAWLRAHYEAPIPRAGDGIVATRAALSETLAALKETIRLQELEADRLTLMETVTVALSTTPRPPRKERKRLTDIAEAIAKLGEETLTAKELEPVLAELARIVAAGEALPEPEEETEEAEEVEAPVVIVYDDPPRPTLEDARARRARQHATAYATPSELTAQLIAEQAYGRPWLSSLQLGRQLAAVDEVALRDQLESCVGHDVASILAPAELTAPGLERAGLSFETLELKAYKKR